jgi:hypothetical protein
MHEFIKQKDKGVVGIAPGVLALSLAGASRGAGQTLLAERADPG